MDCGCKIHYGAGKGGNRIIFCSMHTAAHKMATVLCEVRDHLYQKQDMDRVRELARLALVEVGEC